MARPPPRRHRDIACTRRCLRVGRLAAGMRTESHGAQSLGQARRTMKAGDGGLRMKCLRCEHDNEAGANFCEECAAPLARTCASCGRALSPKARFCPGCANPTGLAPDAAKTPRFASPEVYTPSHLAEKTLTSRNVLEGERKLVTVL